ncbi:MAG: Uma2 family endonuclease [Candidatus Binatia bacterium]
MRIDSPVNEPAPIVLHFGPWLRQMDNHEFFIFCQRNCDWRIERSSEGDLIVQPPTGGTTGRVNFNLTGLFGAWVRSDGTGVGFDSSTGFILPNGAERSPDLAWVRCSRWEPLTEGARTEFPPSCPDFVVEIRSSSDRLATLQGKMREYIANGAQLGWLLDPLEKRVYVYGPNVPMEVLDQPEELSGEPVLPGFV